ncbi:hypothetical protein PR048_012974 [Dryococelus australis]|uniref:Uncharacterized protein n=1 Tax=Dryococelus australis TaxID=614101 RepID=A0ABQ9HRB1_9NEOP|nr:hypothetical protein PR048_012974 [Dryococelus australis]
MKKITNILEELCENRYIEIRAHKSTRCNYLRQNVNVFELCILYQANLIQLIPYSCTDRGFKYLLRVIDCYSKNAWSVPVKNKSAKCIAEAMKLNHKNNHYFTQSRLKAVIVIIFNRTLKTITLDKKNCNVIKIHRYEPRIYYLEDINTQPIHGRLNENETPVTKFSMRRGWGPGARFFPLPNMDKGQEDLVILPAVDKVQDDQVIPPLWARGKRTKADCGFIFT